MTPEIKTFITSALTWLEFGHKPVVDLPGVFALAHAVGKPLNGSADLLGLYLDMDPVVWMEAGGDPFWPVFKNQGVTSWSINMRGVLHP